MSESQSQTWVDLGCGSGTFTEALASLLPAGSSIWAIDKDPQKLAAIPDKFEEVNINKSILDFLDLDYPFDSVDGIFMANALHYVQKKRSFLKDLSSYLASPGKLIIIEYEVRYANPWVPYPINRAELVEILDGLSFQNTQVLGEMNSRYGHVIFSIITEYD